VTDYHVRLSLDGLPPHAAVRYRGFVEARLEAENGLAFLRDRDAEMSKVLNVLSAAVRANPDDKHSARKLVAMRAEADALLAKRNKLNERRACFEQVINTIDNYLRTRGTGLFRGPPCGDDEPPVAQPREGETLVEAIRRVREAIFAAQGELVQVKAAPPPPDEIRAMIRDALEQRARAVPIGHRFERDGLGTERLQLVGPDLMSWLTAGNANPAGMVTAWLYALFPEQVLARFTANIDDTAPGILRDDKPRLIAALEVKIVTLELEEMSLIEQSDGAVLPRPTASPLALLGLQPLRAQPVESEPPLAIAAE